MISALAPDEDNFFALAANALISEGDFEGGVNGFGAGVCEEDGVHPLGKPLGEAGGEFKDLGMPELEGGGEVQFGGLLGDGADDGFAAVSGVAAPESGGGVDELAPIGVAAIHSLGAGDHPRVVAEVAAGGKGHPEVFHFGGGGGHERAGVVGMNKNRGAGGSGKRKIIAKKRAEKNYFGGIFLAVNLGAICRIIRLMTDFLLANWHWVALALASGGGLAWSFIRGAAVALEPGLAVQYVERESGLFLDIRSSAEFGRGHIIRAVNLPAEEIPKRAKEINRYKEKPVVCGVPKWHARAAGGSQAGGAGLYQAGGSFGRDDRLAGRASSDIREKEMSSAPGSPPPAPPRAESETAPPPFSRRFFAWKTCW